MKTTYEHFTPSLALAVILIVASGIAVVNPSYAVGSEKLQPVKVIQLQQEAQLKEIA